MEIQVLKDSTACRAVTGLEFIKERRRIVGIVFDVFSSIMAEAVSDLSTYSFLEV